MLTIVSLVFFFIIGKSLDGEAQRTVNQMYPRNKQGVILGNESVVIQQDENNQAIVLMHGFLDTPKVYSKVIQELKNRGVHADIYAPLLPKHGMNLESAASLNNQEVLDFVAGFLNDLSEQYDCITVNGFSYSGAILTELALEKRLPKNIHLILEAPAIHIRPNTKSNRIRNQVYGLWRNYCNYETFGCNRTFQGYTTDVQEEMLNEDSLMFKIVSSVNQLFDLDLSLRDRMSFIRIPHSVLISQQDNRVNYQEVAQECQQNIEFCNLYTFPKGSHMLHYGNNREKFIDILLKHLQCTKHASQ